MILIAATVTPALSILYSKPLKQTYALNNIAKESTTTYVHHGVSFGYGGDACFLSGGFRLWWACHSQPCLGANVCPSLGIFFSLFWILIVVLYLRGNAGRIQRRVLIPVGVVMLLLATIVCLRPPHRSRL